MAIIKPRRGYTNPSGLTQYELAVDLANKRIFIGNTGGTGDIVAQYIQNYVVSFNGITGAVSGVTTGIGNTFGPLQSFTNGISSSGGTFGGDISVNTIRFGRGRNTDGTSIQIMSLDSSAGSCGINNVGIGHGVFSNQGLSSRGSNNTAVGYSSQSYSTTGYNNASVGLGSLAANEGGANNSVLGTWALYNVQSGSNNSALGAYSLHGGTGSYSNTTAVGTFSLHKNRASENVSVGSYSSYENTSGTANVSVGYQAAYSGVTASNVTALGYKALYLNTVDSNTAVGSGALDANTSGVGNVGIGNDALGANTSGAGNVGIGQDALLNATTGSDIVALGYRAGRWHGSTTSSLTVANQSIFIGSQARAGADSQTNQIVVGFNALGDGSNTTVIGNSSTTSTRVFGTLSTNGGLSAAGLTLSGAFSGSTATFTGLITSTAGFSGTGITLSGNLSAATKSFVIPHPSKPGMRLQYGSLEGPENGVYVRGRLVGTNIIDLPDYWPALIHEDSITVQLTPYGSQKNYFVKSIENNQVTVGCKSKEIDCFYLVQAERKDVPKLTVEA